MTHAPYVLRARTDAQAALLATNRAGTPMTHADVCATIATEVELEQYRIGLRQRDALTRDALHAIYRRSMVLRQLAPGAARGVRGAS